MIGKSIFEVVHPDDKDAVTREVLRQDRETGRGYNSYSGQLDIMGIYNVHFCMYIFPSEITSFLLKACNLKGDAKNKNKIANKLFQNNHSLQNFCLQGCKAAELSLIWNIFLCFIWEKSCDYSVCGGCGY